MKMADIDKLHSTSEADGLPLYAMSRWNPLKHIFIKRLKLLNSMFPEGKVYDKLLEVGYGSGVLIPEFLQRCNIYYGIDIHNQQKIVDEVVRKGDPRIRIGYGDLCECPYPDDMFDCVVSLSVLEHIKDIDKAVREIARVLKKDGVLIAGFPIENGISNLILDIVKLFIGFDRKVHHLSNHKQILSALSKHLINERDLFYPFANIPSASLFYCGVWRK
ncbi:MAG: class I SAM-dependent methyltransferase [Thermodesulfobacteriota bacterium]|nr:class I SAM-dependent methyltransferase [Thermodesulfobacteriota bacterium]